MSVSAPAQQPAPPAPAGLPALEAIRHVAAGSVEEVDLAGALTALAQADLRGQVREAFARQTPFPKKPLVALLRSPQLRLRLGALEILEDAASTDHGFDPWETIEAGPNQAALQKWDQWAGSEAAVSVARPVLSDDLAENYFRDLMADNPERSARALRMLEPHGTEAVVRLQKFLVAHPDLPVAPRGRLKAAQYQILLGPSQGAAAGSIARQLVFGTRDQMLEGITALKQGGLQGVPILREYLSHRDPLVRETTVDAMLTVAPDLTVRVVIEALKTETDPNVLQIAARKFSGTANTLTGAFLAGLIGHENEDVAVTAIESLTPNERSYSSGPRSAPKLAEGSPGARVAAALDDPRWRVRTAALQFFAKRPSSSVNEKVIRLLDDPDSFVRYQAMETAAACGNKAAADRCSQIFVSSPEMAGAAARALVTLRGELNAAEIDALQKHPPDAIVSVLRAVSDENSSRKPDLLIQFASHSDNDVASTCLRLLAANHLESPSVADLLAGRLRQPRGPAEVEAILESINFSGNMRASLQKQLSGKKPSAAPAAAPSGPTGLDDLYDSFGGEEKPKKPEPDPVAIPASASAVGRGGVLGLMDALVEHMGDPGPAAFRVAVQLASAGEPRATEFLVKTLPARPTSQRAALSDILYGDQPDSFAPVLEILLQDASEEVRKGGAELAFNSEKSRAILQVALAALDRVANPLKPVEVYGYPIENAAKESGGLLGIEAWIRKTLSETGAPDREILALTLLRSKLRETDLPGVESRLAAPSIWLRRAAWLCLGRGRPSLFNEKLAQIQADPAPKVRVVVPLCLARGEVETMVHFNDKDLARLYTPYSSDSRIVVLSQAGEQVLRKMLESDPSPEVRFEAGLALISHRKSLDIDGFAALVASLPEEIKARERIGEFLRRNYQSLGAAFLPLVGLADPEALGHNRSDIARHFGGKKADQFLSFDTVQAEPKDGAGEAAYTGNETSDGSGMVRYGSDFGKPVRVVFFFKPGCRECEKVQAWLDSANARFGRPLVVQSLNLMDPSGVVRNQILCDRLSVPPAHQGVAPIVFTQSGFLARDQITRAALDELLWNTANQTPDEWWDHFEEADTARAQAVVEHRYESLTWLAVIGGGLADGINPCAFATIIFFLSYLQVARRTPREILLVGAAFILAVFLAYYCAGLVLNEIIGVIEKFRSVRRFLEFVLGVIALWIAWASFRDARKARAGKLDEMTLQLPGFLKERIRGVVREKTRARNFVVAAFVAGILISFLELACTGQVYAPIIFMIRKGSTSARWLLLVYNLAFIAPLVVVFLLAYGGMRSDALVRFQRNHTAKVKFALGLLFLGLGLFLIL